VSVHIKPSEPGIESRVFQGIVTVTRDGKEVAYCAFIDESFKRIVLAAPDLLAACDAVLKAIYEFDLYADARKYNLENCPDLSIKDLARLMAETPPTVLCLPRWKKCWKFV